MACTYRAVPAFLFRNEPHYILIVNSVVLVPCEGNTGQHSLLQVTGHLVHKKLVHMNSLLKCASIIT